MTLKNLAGSFYLASEAYTNFTNLANYTNKKVNTEDSELHENVVTEVKESDNIANSFPITIFQCPILRGRFACYDVRS